MAIMCCAAPLPLSHHRRSRTVDSYFHVDLGSAEGGENNEQPAVSTISLEMSKLSPVVPRTLVARPAHLRDTRRSKSVDFHANFLADGHRRSKSYKISSSTLASLYSGTSSKSSSKPKAARKAKKGVKFGQVHSRGFNNRRYRSCSHEHEHQPEYDYPDDEEEEREKQARIATRMLWGGRGGSQQRRRGGSSDAGDGEYDENDDRRVGGHVLGGGGYNMYNNGGGGAAPPYSATDTATSREGSSTTTTVEQ